MTPSIQVIVSHREAGKHVYDYTKEHEKLWIAILSLTTCIM
jgi:hypothetical protein